MSIKVTSLPQVNADSITFAPSKTKHITQPLYKEVPATDDSEDSSHQWQIKEYEPETGS